MGICVPRHIICDTFTPNFTPSNSSTTLPTVSVARRARSTVGGDFAPVAGALWRSIGADPADNQITVDVIWENIRRFNGFEFSSPPLPSLASTSDHYVEIDIKIDVYLDGELIETYFDDGGGSPLFTQSAVWQGVNIDEMPGADATVLCWNCVRAGATDTSDIIQILRSNINSNSELIQLPSNDVQTTIEVDDGMGGSNTVTWSDSLDQDYIGPGNVLSDASDLDNAAASNTPYPVATINFSGASLPNPSGSTGPIFSLVLAFDSELDNNNGSIEEGANEVRYWGQQIFPTCYKMTWLPLDNVNNPDCGLPISGFENETTFIVDDLVASTIDPGDTFIVFGPEIEDASAKEQAPFGSHRMTFNIVGATEPGNGTTEITINENLPNLHSRYQAAAEVCRSSTCF